MEAGIPSVSLTCDGVNMAYFLSFVVIRLQVWSIDRSDDCERLWSLPDHLHILCQPNLHRTIFRKGISGTDDCICEGVGGGDYPVISRSVCISHLARPTPQHRATRTATAPECLDISARIRTNSQQNNAQSTTNSQHLAFQNDKTQASAQHNRSHKRPNDHLDKL